MRRQIFSAALAMFALVSAWNCGGGSGSGSPTGPSLGGPTPVTIAITGNNGARSFSPNPAAFGGQMVSFRNNDSIVHRVVLNDGSLDTGDIAPGTTSRSILMPTAGTNYHCSLHTSMIGGVAPSNGEQPPLCVGEYC